MEKKPEHVTLRDGTEYFFSPQLTETERNCIVSVACACARARNGASFEPILEDFQRASDLFTGYKADNKIKSKHTVLTQDNPPKKYEFFEDLTPEEITQIKTHSLLSGKMTYARLAEVEKMFLVRKEVKETIKNNPQILDLSEEISTMLDEYYDPDQKFKELILKFHELKTIVKNYNNDCTEEGLTLLRLFEKYFIKKTEEETNKKMANNNTRMENAFTYAFSPTIDVDQIVKNIENIGCDNTNVETIKSSLHELVVKAMKSKQ